MEFFDFVAGDSSDEEAEYPINFFAEDIDFEPAGPEKLRAWVEKIIAAENCSLNFVNYIFCSDEYLLALNQEHLQHDTLTDIITFPYQDAPEIEGDVFISIERIRENAHTFQVSFERELYRVMAHGVLHLCGYGDKTPEEKAQMTEKEDAVLVLWEGV
jgi:probable rRNA maturation factor